MSTERPVALIISDAIRETATCEQRLAEEVSHKELQLERAKDDRKDAQLALEGLRKLHLQVTKRTRSRETALRHIEMWPADAGLRPKDRVVECLTGSLDMLTKDQIMERTGLGSHSVGVVLGKAVRTGQLVEREGLYGVGQKLEAELASLRS